MHSQHYSPIKDYELPPLDSFFANRPEPESIDNAAEDVPRIIDEEFPFFGRFLICRASDVAMQLQRHRHTLAAALYGLKKQIEAGERYFVLPTAVPENEQWIPWNSVNIFLHCQWNNESSLKSGQLGITIDRHSRIIIRQGYPQEVDLASKAQLWFIFESIFDAAGQEFNVESFKQAFVAKGYKLKGLDNAKSRLKKSLRPFDLTVDGWNIVDTSKD